MYNILLLFVSQLVIVFIFGFQSQIVRLGHKLEAFVMSLLIGIISLIAFKLVPNANIYEMVAYVLGGAIGIVLSIIVHKKWYFYKYGKDENEEDSSN